MSNFLKYCVYKNIIISDALSHLSKNGIKTLIILDNTKRVMGIISDGDLRKNILKGADLNSNIISIINNRFYFLTNSDLKNIDHIKNIFLSKKYEIIPILDKKKKIIDVLEWSSFFSENFNLNSSVISSIPVVVMAGGKGKRMLPYTVSIPKPMLPFKNSSIIETILSSFIKKRFNNFIFVINYKSKLIKIFLESLGYKIQTNYIEEKDYLGTAGGLFYLKNFKHKNYIITNCDVLLNIDYQDILDFHTKNKNHLTLIVSSKNFPIPYGVINLNKNGTLLNIDEKPNKILLVNTGIYIMSYDCIKFLKSNTHKDMDKFIAEIKKNKLKIGAFPVSENDWFDFGQWSEYTDTLQNYNEKI